MTDLRDLTDDQLFSQIGGDWGVMNCLIELARRLSELRKQLGGTKRLQVAWRDACESAEKERDAEVEDHQKTKQLLNGWRDRACDAELARNRLEVAIRVALANLAYAAPNHAADHTGPTLNAASVLRAALKKEGQ